MEAIMTSETNLAKWGASLGLRIPQNFVKKLDLKQGTRLVMNVQDDKLIIKKRKELQDLCDKISKSNLNIDSEWIDDENTDKEW